MIAPMRSLAAAAAIAAVVTGCSNIRESEPRVAPMPVAPQTSAAAPPTSTTAPAEDDSTGGTGIVAKPASTAFPMEARDIRLVRLDDQDIALQFELFNGTKENVEPYDIGMGLIERDFKLVDLARATSYDVQQADGFDGRVSDNQYEEIAPGLVDHHHRRVHRTAGRRNEALVHGRCAAARRGADPTCGLEPAQKRSGADGPARRRTVCRHAGCARTGAPRSKGRRAPVGDQAAQRRAVRVRQVRPHPGGADAALDGVEEQLGSAKGTITIEGHTDAIGDDPSNQTLSEARAASVQAALQERLGSGFTFNAVGFGESRPVAPNTNPDGSDNPDGRAENRRVEIRSGDVTEAGPPELEARELPDDLAAQGATVTVDSVKRISGHLLTAVTITNPTSTAIEVPQEQRPVQPRRPSRSASPWPTGPTSAGPRCAPPAVSCSKASASWPGLRSSQFEPTGDHLLLPGESVQLWGFYAAPPADVTTVDVEIGGLGKSEPTPITS